MDKEKLSTQSLVFGILSLVFNEFSILGIIFGAIGKGKAKKFAAENGGVVTGKAKVGKILSTVGLVLGIIGLVCAVIIALACIASPEFRQALMSSYGL